jgi:hypothetical protein
MGRNNDPEQVRRLQQFLNTEMGAGLPVTGFFGVLTDAAVKAFQKKYASAVLTPWDINEPTGYVYLTTKKKINELYCRGASAFPLTPEEQKRLELEKVASGQNLNASFGRGPTTAASPQGGEKTPALDDESVLPEDFADEPDSTSGSAGSQGASTKTSLLLKDWGWLIVLFLLGLGLGWYFWE